MEKPTEQELKEICEKFKLNDISDDYNEEIFLQKQLDSDFTLNISLEVLDDDIKYVSSKLSLDLIDSDLTEDLYSGEADHISFENLIRTQIYHANDNVVKYDKIIPMILKIEDFLKCNDLNIEFAKALIEGELSGW